MLLPQGVTPAIYEIEKFNGTHAEIIIGVFEKKLSRKHAKKTKSEQCMVKN
jgi:hypothetical protein